MSTTDYHTVNMRWDNPLIENSVRWQGCVNFSIIDDGHPEETEIVQVVAALRLPDSRPFFIQREVEIFDNDG